MINIKNYDFLDFGASKGASIEFAKKKLFGKKGLGVDLDPKRVKIMQETGYDCMVGDITALNLPAKSVRFVKMSHILEHMPDLGGVKKAVESAKKVATDFLVITGPYFDQDTYLRSKGFKLDWSDYPEHTCHLTVKQMINILDELKIDTYELYLRHKITDSSSVRIHPLDSPPGSHNYDSKIHSPKKQINFEKDIWTDFVCYVRLGTVKNWDEITKAYNNQILYIENIKGKKSVTPKRALSMYGDIENKNLQLRDNVQTLKNRNKLLIERNLKLESRLNSILNSSAWKVASRLQKTSHIIRGRRFKKERK